MPALARNQASNCANPVLDLFTRVAGALVDVYSLEFIIWDVSDAAKQITPVQVYPPTGRATVNVGALCSDPIPGHKLSTGRFVAEYTPDIAEPLGTHAIQWFFKLTGASPEQTFSEEFEVLPEATASGETGYAYVTDLRDEGVTDAMADDAKLLRLISLCSKRIDQLTGQWFEPRALTITLDGSGSPNLLLYVPIIAIDSIAIDGTAIDLDAVKVYNRHLTERLLDPDDRRNPRVEFVSSYTGDVYQRAASTVWPHGQRNVELAGTFGFTDWSSSSSYGETPALINHVCKLLVIRELTPMADVTARHEAANLYRLTVEQTRDQKVQYGALKSTDAVGWLTGDPEIDGILEHYMAPMHVGHPGGGLTD